MTNPTELERIAEEIQAVMIQVFQYAYVADGIDEVSGAVRSNKISAMRDQERLLREMLQAFAQRLQVPAGYKVVAEDATPEMVAATEAFAGVPTRLMRFEEFEWDHEFEGIWACASLLHVAMADLPLVLDKLAFRLVSDGVIYLSFKLGTGERTKDGRRFTDMTEESLRKVLDLTAGLTQFQVWLSHDRRPDKASEMWLNALVKKA